MKRVQQQRWTLRWSLLFFHGDGHYATAATQLNAINYCQLTHWPSDVVSITLWVELFVWSLYHTVHISSTRRSGISSPLCDGAAFVMCLSPDMLMSPVRPTKDLYFHHKNVNGEQTFIDVIISEMRWEILNAICCLGYQRSSVSYLGLHPLPIFAPQRLST